METDKSQRSVSGESDTVDLDFLMPHSFIIPMSCSRQASLGSLKPDLWRRALQLPAANHLRDSMHYVFIGVTKDAVEIQLDDSLTIQELELVAPLLELSEPKRQRDLNKLHNTVGEAIGIKVDTLDSLSTSDPQLQELRALLKTWCQPIAARREEWTLEKSLLFFYPPNLDLNVDLPFCTEEQMSKLPNGLLTITVFWTEESTNKYEVKVYPTMPPVAVVKEAISVRNKELGRHQTDKMATELRAEELYVMKVCGREEYLLQECCLHSYQYIRTCINRSTVPVLQMVLRQSLINYLPDNPCILLSQPPSPLPSPTTMQQNVLSNENSVPTVQSSWDILDLFTIRVNNLLGKVPDASMSVKAQIYHGSQVLCTCHHGCMVHCKFCQPFQTLNHGWKQPWSFSIPVQQLPKNARLCFTIHVVDKNTIHSWYNHQIFDTSGRLTTGCHSLRVWTMDQDYKLDSYPQGTPGGNPDKTAPVLDFEIVSPCKEDVYFPSNGYIDTLIQKRSVTSEQRPKDGLTFEKVDEFVERDPLIPLNIAEKQRIWKNRHFVMEYSPKLLPRLVQCVRWSDRHEVIELYCLLHHWSWERLNLTSALQLLGYEYADNRVRSLAVKCLRQMLKPQLVGLFLLQLVQALKFECYPYNPLVCYLLEQALLHIHIGHRFFWLLRSEMEDPLSQKLFSPLLEAYCLYCGSHVLNSRVTDVRCMNRYQEVAVSIAQISNHEEQEAILQKWLATEATRHTLENKPATLDHDIQLGQIRPDECRVLMSKMRPLWITWLNRSQLASEINIGKIRYIIKNGDDLRQDMLVMQVLKVMDMLWKYACNDYWLTIYNCMAMGHHFGMIEVVMDAETVCSIQMEKQGMAQGIVGADSLHAWLYENNTGNAYMEAVKRFTNSCAGYCVATYILGIKDRHSDNIMVSKDGQFFHIDFGHIMDHKKTKLGINRERTPFILTEDFIRVICMGSVKYKKNDNFREFQYKCFEAYMTIRRHANLFLTLLNLMLHSNLPELKEIADINYCRLSLALDQPEHKAGQHFLEMFFRSYRGQWKTNIDWFFHRFNKVTRFKSGSLKKREVKQ